MASCPACSIDVDLGDYANDGSTISCPKCKANLQVQFEAETGKWALNEEEELKAHIGLTPEEMLIIFNKMYDNTWKRLREKFKDEEISETLFQFTETVVICIRDAAVLTLHENNERIHEKLLQQGIPKK